MFKIVFKSDNLRRDAIVLIVGKAFLKLKKDVLTFFLLQYSGLWISKH